MAAGPLPQKTIQSNSLIIHLLVFLLCLHCVNERRRKEEQLNNQWKRNENEFGGPRTYNPLSRNLNSLNSMKGAANQSISFHSID